MDNGQWTSKKQGTLFAVSLFPKRARGGWSVENARAISVFGNDVIARPEESVVFHSLHYVSYQVPVPTVDYDVVYRYAFILYSLYTDGSQLETMMRECSLVVT